MLSLRAKKKCSQQVFHSANSFCGKGVDWIYKFDSDNVDDGNKPRGFDCTTSFFHDDSNVAAIVVGLFG